MSTITETSPAEQAAGRDEDDLIGEIQNRSMQRLVYHSNQYGPQLTLRGVYEAIRLLNARGLARIGVTSTTPVITRDDAAVTVLVYAADDLNGGGSWGVAVQPLASNGKADEDALEKALSKAQRNALRTLIPADQVQAMIDAFLAQAGKDHRVPPPQAGGPLGRLRYDIAAQHRQGDGYRQVAAAARTRAVDDALRRIDDDPSAREAVLSAVTDRAVAVAGLSNGETTVLAAWARTPAFAVEYATIRESLAGRQP